MTSIGGAGATPRPTPPVVEGEASGSTAAGTGSDGPTVERGQGGGGRFAAFVARAQGGEGGPRIGGGSGHHPRFFGGVHGGGHGGDHGGGGGGGVHRGGGHGGGDFPRMHGGGIRPQFVPRPGGVEGGAPAGGEVPHVEGGAPAGTVEGGGGATLEGDAASVVVHTLADGGGPALPGGFFPQGFSLGGRPGSGPAGPGADLHDGPGPGGSAPTPRADAGTLTLVGHGSDALPGAGTIPRPPGSLPGAAPADPRVAPRDLTPGAGEAFLPPPPPSSETSAASVPLLPPHRQGDGAGWAEPKAGAALGAEAPLAESAAPEDLPLLSAMLSAPPPGEGGEATRRARGWAQDPVAPGGGPRPGGPSPQAAALLGSLKGGLADDHAAAARAILAAGPEAAGEALAALALEGPIDRMLATELLSALPEDAQSTLIDHLEAALPPEEREAVLAAMGVVDDGAAAGGDAASASGPEAGEWPAGTAEADGASTAEPGGASDAAASAEGAGAPEDASAAGASATTAEGAKGASGASTASAASGASTAEGATAEGAIAEGSTGAEGATAEGATDASIAEGGPGAKAAEAKAGAAGAASAGAKEGAEGAEEAASAATAAAAAAAAGKGAQVAGAGAKGIGAKGESEAAASGPAGPGGEAAALQKKAAEGKIGLEGRGGAGGKGGDLGAEAEKLGAAGGARGAAGPSGASLALKGAEARAATLSPQAAEARQLLQVALAARMAGGPGGAEATAGALGAAFGGLARLLKGDPEDACAVIDDCFAPKAAYVLHQHERRTGDAGGEGAKEEADELIDAMRSLDFAGLKAVALERAASRIAGLRAELTASGEPAKAEELGRARTQAALLLASDPVGVARFGRESPETFPRTAARSVMGELLRASEAAVTDALAAALALLLRPAAVGSGAHKAFAAGYWCGAGAGAAARIAQEESIIVGVAEAEAAGRALAQAAAAGRLLAQRLGPSPGGVADRDEALRTLDQERGALDGAIAEAARGEGAFSEGALEARRLGGVLRSALAADFSGMDPDVEQDLEGELLAGFRSAGA